MRYHKDNRGLLERDSNIGGSAEIIVDDRYGWAHSDKGALKYWYIGAEKPVTELVSFCHKHPEADVKQLSSILRGCRGHFAVIIQQRNRVIAATDKTRSYPVFYEKHRENFKISNSARALKQNLNLSEIDELSILEFKMAGYVTGRETLYENLYQVQAGELIVWDKILSRIDCERYYIYFSEEIRKVKEEDLIDELAEVTKGIFSDLASSANGATIWVPLSGGLDSRLVLCMLKQVGYESIRAFSYGPTGNYEVKAAQYIAEKLDVPWISLSLNMRESREFFWSDLRRAYWAFADGLSNIPNMQDIHVLSRLINDGRVAPNDVIVNGQSGDFITGGHIPSCFLKEKPSISLLLNWVIDRHYSLWKHFKIEKNLNLLKEKILHLIDVDMESLLDRQTLSNVYERWEWQERQCKYVLNGQRIYDFLGLKWSIPLWHDDYLRFWERIPLNHKFGQSLYKKYLDRLDYFGCFRNFKPRIWRWPGMTIAVVPLARVLRLILGKTFSDHFYHYAKYIGHYRQSYAPYNFTSFIKIAHKIRNPVSLNIETWILENL